jgi:hypothetical protein
MLNDFFNTHSRLLTSFTAIVRVWPVGEIATTLHNKATASFHRMLETTIS